MGYARPMTRTVFRKLVPWIPVALSLVLLLAIFLIAESGQKRLTESTYELATSAQRSAEIEEFMRSVLDAESAQRGFLLTQNSRYLQAYDPSVRRINVLLDSLANSYIAIHSTEGLTAVRNARIQAVTKIGEIASTLRLYGESGMAAAMALMETDFGARTMESLRKSVDELHAIERRRFAQIAAAWQRDLTQQRWLLASATLLNIVLVLLSGGFLVRNYLRREELSQSLSQQNSELDRLVRERTRNLSELSSHLQSVSEREKASLARELHDELGGLLVAAKMDVVWLRRRIGSSPEDLEVRWERVVRALEQGVALKRRVIESLRPTLLDNLGLIAALRWLVEETARSAGIRGVEQYPEDLPVLSDDANIALYRIAQESLTNVVKHARASEIRLKLSCDDVHLCLIIEDDGVGIAAECVAVAQSHGLLSMRHRAAALDGELRVTRPASGRGTRIEVIMSLRRAAA